MAVELISDLSFKDVIPVGLTLVRPVGLDMDGLTFMKTRRMSCYLIPAIRDLYDYCVLTSKA